MYYFHLIVNCQPWSNNFILCNLFWFFSTFWPWRQALEFSFLVYISTWAITCHDCIFSMIGSSLFPSLSLSTAPSSFSSPFSVSSRPTSRDGSASSSSPAWCLPWQAQNQLMSIGQLPGYWHWHRIGAELCFSIALTHYI